MRSVLATTPPEYDNRDNHAPRQGCQPIITMSTTHTNLLYHLIFATKQREPVIAPAWRAQLHEYLGGTVRGLGGMPQGVGGVADHVHLLVSLKPTHCISDFMRELKKTSSRWVRETIGVASFHWQDGYAAFTVSASSRNSVRTYIAGQEEHHQVKTFRDELVSFLKKSGVDFDERFLD